MRTFTFRFATAVNILAATPGVPVGFCDSVFHSATDQIYVAVSESEGDSRCIPNIVDRLPDTDLLWNQFSREGGLVSRKSSFRGDDDSGEFSGWFYTNGSQRISVADHESSEKGCCNIDHVSVSSVGGSTESIS